jgi:hypothetical protein
MTKFAVRIILVAGLLASASIGMMATVPAPAPPLPGATAGGN